MEWGFLFIFNSVLLGVGLAMDAFSVSLTNGLNEPDMKRGRMCGIAGVFAGFQALMPMLGWICVRTVVQYLVMFEKFIPWLALVLLVYIGGKMLIDGIRKKDSEEKEEGLGAGALFLQGVATSIDALSVGFTIAGYGWIMALSSALIIAGVTFIICMAGLMIGKKFGTRLSDRAQILGGVILIVIGVEIFIKGIM
ncbi:MAG: manganese efflux pump [Lachnospiraceae bacterium]|nr:manganese efflux pump [Lachnospiraceae bacterium]